MKQAEVGLDGGQPYLITRFKLSLIAFSVSAGTFTFSVFMLRRTIDFSGFAAFLGMLIGAPASVESGVSQSGEWIRLTSVSGFFCALALYWVLYELANKFDTRAPAANSAKRRFG